LGLCLEEQQSPVAASQTSLATAACIPLISLLNYSQLGSSFQNGTSFFEVGIMSILRVQKIKAGLNLLGRGKKTRHKLGDYSLFMRQWPQSPTEWCTE